jgi:uncharacterized protein (DUF302 family)
VEYCRSITLDVPYEQAVPRVKEAFMEQGFGTLTEIDVRATLHQKLGKDFPPYVILGACNPELAHEALQIEPEIGVLLPCNVVVRSVGDTTVVHALDPRVMVTVPENPAIEDVAERAGQRIQAALDALARSWG